MQTSNSVPYVSSHLLNTAVKAAGIMPEKVGLVTCDTVRVWDVDEPGEINSKQQIRFTIYDLKVVPIATVTGKHIRNYIKNKNSKKKEESTDA